MQDSKWRSRFQQIAGDMSDSWHDLEASTGSRTSSHGQEGDLGSEMPSSDGEEAPFSDPDPSDDKSHESRDWTDVKHDQQQRERTSSVSNLNQVVKKPPRDTVPINDFFQDSSQGSSSIESQDSMNSQGNGNSRGPIAEEIRNKDRISKFVKQAQAHRTKRQRETEQHAGEVNSANVVFKLQDHHQVGGDGINMMGLTVKNLKWHVPLGELPNIIDALLHGDPMADRHEFTLDVKRHKDHLHHSVHSSSGSSSGSRSEGEEPSFLMHLGSIIGVQQSYW